VLENAGIIIVSLFGVRFAMDIQIAELNQLRAANHIKLPGKGQATFNPLVLPKDFEYDGIDCHQAARFRIHYEELHALTDLGSGQTHCPQVGGDRTRAGLIVDKLEHIGRQFPDLSIHNLNVRADPMKPR
jgi:hypothetical protein